MKALIDGDIVAFRCAASCQGKDKETGKPFLEPVEVALQRVENLMQEIIQATSADSYHCFLSPSKNFRYTVYPEYKANRKDTVDPVHRQACKDYLSKEWNAETFDNYEADDALAWHQTEGTVICSIDKDLLQIPGNHYNFVKKEMSHITDVKGIHNFYVQVLVGDRVDNLIGLDGIGPVKANRYLEGCYNEQDMFDTVNDLYNDRQQLATNLLCMWLCRKKGETWLEHQKNSRLIIPSELKQEVDLMYASMKSSIKIM